MTEQEIVLMLQLVKHGWDSGVVRSETGASEMTRLRVHLEELLSTARECGVKRFQMPTEARAE